MLTVENISIKRGDKQIIQNVSFSVSDGEILGILGPNGAGKSTLAYALMGSAEYSPDSGKLTFDGRDITKMPIDERARLGITMVWQEPARFEGIPVMDYILLGSKTKGEGLAADCLEKMRLSSCDYTNRQVDRTLSGGERKKVELASLLAMRPKLAILDEPDSGIDMLSQDAITGLAKDIKGYGGSVVLITHEEDVAKIADRVALMCAGLAFKVGRPDEMIDYYKNKCKPCPTKHYPAKGEAK